MRNYNLIANREGRGINKSPSRTRRERLVVSHVRDEERLQVQTPSIAGAAGHGTVRARDVILMRILRRSSDPRKFAVQAYNQVLKYR